MKRCDGHLHLAVADFAGRSTLQSRLGWPSAGPSSPLSLGLELGTSSASQLALSETHVEGLDLLNADLLLYAAPGSADSHLRPGELPPPGLEWMLLSAAGLPTLEALRAGVGTRSTMPLSI